MVSGVAGPSGSHSKKQRLPESQPSHSSPTKRPKVVSADYIDESSEDEDHDETDLSSQVSQDSEGDIENVEPKRRANVPASSRSRPSTILPKYVPPSGMTPCSLDVSFKDSPFEYDKMASSSSNVQLWIIRVPSDFKPSRLTALSVKPPTSQRSLSGSLKYKSTSFSLISAGSSTPSASVVDDQGRQPISGPSATDSMTMAKDSLRIEGAEEMDGGMRLLVPRLKENGKLLVVPLPISQQLLLIPQLPHGQESVSQSDDHLCSFLSTSAPRSAASPADLMELVLPPKRSQPSHLLKFRNRAYGFDTPGPVNGLGGARSMYEGQSIPEQLASSKKKRKSEIKSSPKKKKVKSSDLS